jgi:hypothetical protein
MNKQYFLQTIREDHTIIRAENEDSSTTFIPMDEVCAEYQEYLAWVAEGNTAEEWSPDATI